MIFWSLNQKNLNPFAKLGFSSPYFVADRNAKREIKSEILNILIQLKSISPIKIVFFFFDLFFTLCRTAMALDVTAQPGLATESIGAQILLY
jgi:hypothetical protein